MRSKPLILTLIILTILGATAVVAQQRGRAIVMGNSSTGIPADGLGPDGAMGPLGPITRCFGAIGLTDEQKTALKTLVQAEIPTLQALHETMKTDEDAMKALIEATTPDPCAVGTAALKVHADREALRTELESIRTKVEALLTTEQKLKLAGCLAALNPPKP